MDIVLHTGAHRTASTSFQRYMRDIRDTLAMQGIAYWGPPRTRKGLFHGVADGTAPVARAGRPAGRVLMNTRAAARNGYRMVVVSDENMLGTPRDNIRRGLLYPAVGQRMARFHAAFGGQVSRIVLTIRSPELYWASLHAYALPRGVPFPLPGQMSAIARALRSWRDVIVDLACAVPAADLCVVPFERLGGQQDAMLRVLTGQAAPPLTDGYWMNKAPDLSTLRGVLADRGEDPRALPVGEGRWMPFTPQDAAWLRERYADDLHWLTGGADGIARLIEDPDPDRTRITWPEGLLRRGHRDNDRKERRMAQGR